MKSETCPCCGVDLEEFYIKRDPQALIKGFEIFLKLVRLEKELLNLPRCEPKNKI